ncbi:BRISC and BRCA1-A complex member 1 [Mizuhopecten yessoensis]|uniref:BRISC and BRCA1-A complex member 1 n=2 Tax=Mizuhopecten yessoensis TaxID=6573 RepID=A0A210PP11_MIZYE|nr:BRISC and BRCA1-A complex member 1 [Mizuhopecten yessoensis]
METGSPPENTDTSSRLTFQEYDITENPLLADDIQNDALFASTARAQHKGSNSESPPEQHHQLDLQTNQDNKDSDSSQDDLLELTCPRVNCQEKIIICLDLSAEMDKVTFRSRSGDKWTPLKLIKRALRLFLQSKSRINKKHQYALIILQENAVWVRDFSSNPREIIHLLDDLEDTSPCDTLNIGSIFDLINSRVELPQVSGDPAVLPPPYIVRTLLLLGRSQGTINMADKEMFRFLDSSPYFFVDALYVHEPPSEDNKCEQIFDCICDLDEKGQSYIFEAARNPTKLYDQMAQLLAHPLQRPLQRDIAYRLLNMADLEVS